MPRSTAAPTSPFSVTPQLADEATELAPFKGVRMHVHGSETVAEQGHLSRVNEERVVRNAATAAARSRAKAA
ncbi:hypothetical protein [Streptomyces sp. SID3343]|uniref:hypothetical protein n=1 Tax=Streptomyces sp. SID3343 TaxID=2690260 RepID=UPI0019257A76